MKHLSIAASMVLTLGLAIPAGATTATSVGETSPAVALNSPTEATAPQAVDVDPTVPSSYEIDLLKSPGLDAEPAVSTSDFGYQLLTAPMEVEEFHVAGVTWQGDNPNVVELRTFSNGAWGEWYILDIEDTGEGTPGTEPFIDGGSTAVQVRANGATIPEVLTLSLQTGDGLGGTAVVESDPDVATEEPAEGSEEDAAVNADDVVVEPSSLELPEAPVPAFSADGPVSTADIVDFVNSAVVFPQQDSTLAGSASFNSVSTTPVTTSVLPQILRSGRVAAPTVMRREQWGAPKWSATWASTNTVIHGAIVHHTAGSNYYTEAQAPGVVKGIWNYHTYSRGWGDIGYNFLIDKYGNVYEGRAGSLDAPDGYTVVGAHAAPSNTNSLGVSVMGTYTGSVVPTRTVLSAMERVIAWQFSGGNVNPFGTRLTKRRVYNVDSPETINNIAGHKDVAQTACPANIYGHLPTVRTNVKRLMDSATTPDRPTLSATYPNLSAVTTPARTGRVAGKNRYYTAVKISQRQFADPSKAWRVYLVRGDVAADAQVAGVLEDGPILLTPRDGLPAVVAQEIKRLNVSSIVVIGSEGAVSDATANQAAAAAKAKTGKGNIYRVGGANRIKTAINVSQYKFTRAEVETVYLADAFGADGLGSPDAIAAGVFTDGPILLVDENKGMTADVRAEIARVNPYNVVQLGGNLQLTGSDTPDAIYAGKNRQVTSAIIASQAQPKPATVYLARSDVYADALAAGGLTDGPVLLVNDRMTAQACNYLRSAKPGSIVALGGTTAVPNTALNEAARCAGR